MADGSALMIVFGLVPKPTRQQLSQPSDRFESDCICAHTGVVATDLVRVATESLDMTGDAECLRHIIVVDHSQRAVVVALRGTASISDGA